MQGWHRDLLQQFACVGIPFCDLRATPHCDPQIAVGVGGHAVGPAEGFGDMNRCTWICNLPSCEVIVKGFDFARGRVDVIKGFVVGTPGESVGDGHAAE